MSSSESEAASRQWWSSKGWGTAVLANSCAQEKKTTPASAAVVDRVEMVAAPSWLVRAISGPRPAGWGCRWCRGGEVVTFVSCPAAPCRHRGYPSWHARSERPASEKHVGERKGEEESACIKGVESTRELRPRVGES